MTRKPEWTEGRMKAFITSTLRGGMRRYPPKWKALEKAFVGVEVNKTTKRKGKHYKCVKCKDHFPTSGVQVDHKKPVVDPKVGFVDWDTFISRLFCPVTGLQVLCKSCHDKKTKREREMRKKYAH